MRYIAFFIATILVTLIATEVSAAENREPAQSYTCRIVTGYGTSIGRGSSQLKAKEVAREVCGSKIIDQYVAQRGHIDPSVVDDLVLSCVNLECQ